MEMRVAHQALYRNIQGHEVLAFAEKMADIAAS